MSDMLEVERLAAHVWLDLASVADDRNPGWKTAYTTAAARFGELGLDPPDEALIHPAVYLLSNLIEAVSDARATDRDELLGTLRDLIDSHRSE